MNEPTSIDGVLKKSFQLAYFILGDRMTAISVCMIAMHKLKIATTTQDRRLSYTPIGRSAFRAARTKISLSELHLLQRLIYVEAEPFERLLERQNDALQQQELVIRFIKHLVRITIKRNSFYVSLGLCRLLYNYATAETAEVYNLVVQDPDRARDDYSYRSGKSRLMQELKERFASKVQSRRGARGEERFQPQESSEKYMSLVRECLLRFMPWHSSCVLPARFNPTMDILNPLLFNGEDPDEEHYVELNRIHTLLHPDCFGRLVLALGFDSPEKRLEVPYFFISNSAPAPPDDRLHPRDLDEEELNAIKSSIDKKAARRKDTPGRLLAVLIDGRERARIELDKTNRVDLEIEEGSEIIEVQEIGVDEEVSLAIHPLLYDRSGIAQSRCSIALEGGQKVSFLIHPSKEGSDKAEGALASILYQETRPIKAASFVFRRLKQQLSEIFSGSTREVKLALGLLILTLGIVIGWLYWQSKTKAPSPPSLAGNENSAPQTAGQSSSEPPTVPPLPEQAKNDGQPENPVTSPGHRPKQPRGSRLPSIGNAGETRGSSPTVDPTLLLGVKRVYVESFEPALLSKQFRELLINSLHSSSRFVVVQNPDQADALFRGSVKQTGESLSLTIRLVNAEGNIIWPLSGRKPGRKYSGQTKDIAARILKDMLEEIQRLENQR